jgi:hypothetical protein
MNRGKLAQLSKKGKGAIHHLVVGIELFLLLTGDIRWRGLIHASERFVITCSKALWLVVLAQTDGEIFSAGSVLSVTERLIIENV